MATKINTISDLLSYINDRINKLDLIIVCGYDNVGKGMILDLLSSKYKVFHPDYKFICEHVSKEDRWTYFMYFLDILQTFKSSFQTETPLVFDRSSLCGSVYNNNPYIAKMYASKLKDLNVLHVLVTCDKPTYVKLSEVRNNDTKFNYEDYLIYTERYKSYMNLLDISYVEYNNIYDETLGNYLSKVCGGCSHFKNNMCINPRGIKSNKYDSERCEFTNDAEVQDVEM